MYNKKGFEFTFAWMFSMIVGAVILFLAIYGVVNLIGSERNVIDSFSAQQLGIILQPLETQSFESGIRPMNINFPSETKLGFRCNNEDVFGSETVDVASKSGVGKEWQTAGVGATIHNKYVFAEKSLEGKTFYLFLKPLKLPFKVTDLVYIWDKNYCFISPPQDVEDDFSSLGINESGVQIVSTPGMCKSKSVKVCFGAGYSVGDNCEIVVDTGSKKIQKNGRNIYYEGPLMYGGIFGDVDLYDCNLKRIMMRAGSIAQLYKDTSEMISSKSPTGCSSALQPELVSYIENSNINSAGDAREVYRRLNLLSLKSAELEKLQKPLTCALWRES